MTSTERLLDLVDALDEAKVPFLVMDGHAVRYYGLERNTADFDFHLSLAAADALPERLARTRLFQSALLREETTWRGGDFRRLASRQAEGSRGQSALPRPVMPQWLLLHASRA